MVEKGHVTAPPDDHRPGRIACPLTVKPTDVTWRGNRRHEQFDIRGWDTQSGRPLGLIFGDQRPRDIVVVARTLLDRVGRRHAVPVAIKQHPGEQAQLVCAGAE